MGLRVYKADEFPIYQNDDGLFNAWAGTSIMADPMNPTSLTIFDANNASLIFRSQYRDFEPVQRFGFKIARPWFDHPILASLFIALPAKLFGFTGMQQIPHMLVRLPALIASFISIILAFILARDLFSQKTAWFTLLFLAFWPLHIFSSRQSYFENIMTPVWLLGLWCLWRFRKNKQRPYFVTLILTAVVLGWSKIIGNAAFLVYSFWLHYFRFHRRGWFLLLVGVISFSLYLTYGHILGGNYFWNTLLHQGGRGSYLSSFFYILTHPDVQGVVADGWWFISLISLWWLSGKKTKPGLYIVLNGLFWFGVVFLTSGQDNTSPWYRYPTYPLLAIASGRWLAEWWQKKSLWMTLVFLLLGFTGWELAGIQVGGSLIRVLFAAIAGLFAAGYIWPKTSGLVILKQWTIAGLLLVAIMGNVLAVKNYPRKICADGGCLLPTKLQLELP